MDNEKLIALRTAIDEERQRVDRVIQALALFADVSIKKAWDIVNNYLKSGQIR